MNNVIKVNFRKGVSPMALEMTKHLTNMIHIYGKQTTTQEFRAQLTHPEGKGNARAIEQLINHYGVNAWKKWFTDVYGWDFNEKVA